MAVAAEGDWPAEGFVEGEMEPSARPVVVTSLALCPAVLGVERPVALKKLALGWGGVLAVGEFAGRFGGEELGKCLAFLGVPRWDEGSEAGVASGGFGPFGGEDVGGCSVGGDAEVEAAWARDAFRNADGSGGGLVDGVEFLGVESSGGPDDDFIDAAVVVGVPGQEVGVVVAGEGRAVGGPCRRGCCGAGPACRCRGSGA